MGLDDDAVKSQQGGPAVNLGVHAAFQAGEGAFGQQRAKLAQRTGRNLGVQLVADGAAEAFGGLQHNVADKAVAHHHVHAVVEQVKSFDVANIIQIQLRAQLRGFAGQVGAFGFFRAVAQDAHAGTFQAQNFMRIRRPHHGKLREMGWFDGRVGPGIQEDEILIARGEAADNGGTLDAVEAPEFHGAGHQCPGVARGNDGVSLLVPHQFNGAYQRRILFAADAFQRLVFHRQHFAGVDHFNPGIRKLNLSAGGGNILLAPNQQHFGNGIIGSEGQLDPSQGDHTSVVAAHDIHCYSHS